MRKPKTNKKGEKIGGRSQAFYIDRIIYDEIGKDADEDDRSKSYIVNQILKEYYIRKKRIKKY